MEACGFLYETLANFFIQAEIYHEFYKDIFLCRFTFGGP